MYFFDGHNLFRDADATYGKCWGLEEFLSAGEKDIIVVGIECGHEGNDGSASICPIRRTGEAASPELRPWAGRPWIGSWNR